MSEVYQSEIDGFLHTLCDVGSVFLLLVHPMLAWPSIPTAPGSSHGLTPAAAFIGNPPQH